MLTSMTVETFDSHVVSLLDKLDHVRGELRPCPLRLSMQVEVRRLEFWRAVISECLATLLLVFLVCSANVPWSPLDVWTAQRTLSGALVTGFSVAVLTQCFWRSSGAHMNPAISLAAAAVGRITPLRCLLYTAAQCGGAVAGAALLYGSSAPSVQGALGVTLVTPPLTPWQGFANEFTLTFILVLVFFSVTEPSRRPLGNSSVIIGFSYLAASLAGIRSTGASMNPARSLGPAFVMDIWKDHWVYWLAPISASVLAALIHNRLYNPHRQHGGSTQASEIESAGSQMEDDCLDDEPPPVHADLYGTMRSQRRCFSGPPRRGGGATVAGYYQSNMAARPLAACDSKSLYAASYDVYDDSRSIYGGATSMYAGAQPARPAAPSPRGNFMTQVTRSQSMYMKDRVHDWTAEKCSPEEHLRPDQRALSSYIAMDAPPISPRSLPPYEPPVKPQPSEATAIVPRGQPPSHSHYANRELPPKPTCSAGDSVAVPEQRINPIRAVDTIYGRSREGPDPLQQDQDPYRRGEASTRRDQLAMYGRTGSYVRSPYNTGGLYGRADNQANQERTNVYSNGVHMTTALCPSMMSPGSVVTTSSASRR